MIRDTIVTDPYPLPPDKILRVRTERCDDCLYRLSYPKRTRDAILGEVKKHDSYVRCHTHDASAAVCCNGYFTAVGEDGGAIVQIAIRLNRMRAEQGEDGVIAWVAPGECPPAEDDDDDDEG